MIDEKADKLRLRIRLKNGEEFEAEGDAAFIARQKDSFLSLVNGEQPRSYERPELSLPKRPLPIAASDITPELLPPYLKNSVLREQNKDEVPLPQKDVWDKTAYCDGQDIILRRKDKNIKPSSAALIILGAAKVLKNVQGMSALELSKSLKLSGYLKGIRLDRAVAPEVKDGAMVFEGSKRNRSYRLTQKGLAKAFTAAEKAILAEEKQKFF